MSFLWPPALALLVLTPALIWAYLRLQRRRARRAAELAAQGFAPTAATARLRVRRHIPNAFFIAGLTLLLFAVARPQMAISDPQRQGTVILAFDVSNSMLADDLQPSRIEAAKVAAKAFVAEQPSSVKLGVVAFSTGAIITQQPTLDRSAVVAAIERLKPQGGTSLGQGMFSALSAIAGKPLEVDTEALAAGGEGTAAVDIGYYSSAAVVLLTDGENTVDPDPLEVAKLASLAGVKVHPVGIGSPEGTVVEIDGYSVATALDEGLLQEIADTTDGAYRSAADSEALTDVYKSIDLEWHSESRRTEITGVLTAISTALFVIGAGLSLLWFGRVV